ncbi:hypothetical protein PG994_006934 [Apiospora phragmitis]|uniref:Uncharacterized protein n=1 Tax=Apiospora phragmitis TaxID=2905665 RepID=A0ABR1VGD9_9PEZI
MGQPMQPKLAYDKSLEQLRQESSSLDRLVADMLDREEALESSANRTIARKGELTEEILARKEELQEVTKETLARRM